MTMGGTSAAGTCIVYFVVSLIRCVYFELKIKQVCLDLGE